MRKCPAGMGFEIFLEGQRLVLIRESAIPGQLPGFEFGSVGGFAGIVLRNSPLQVCGRAYVFLVGKLNAADDVDVPPRVPNPSSQAASRVVLPPGTIKDCVVQPVVALRAMLRTL